MADNLFKQLRKKKKKKANQENYFKNFLKVTDREMISCPSQRFLDLSDSCTMLNFSSKLIASINYFGYDF